MKRRVAAFAFGCLLELCARGSVWSASDVLDGDPIDPASGQAYEVLPGYPRYWPGDDGIQGTGDDQIDFSVVGDIDIVVRTGSPVAAPAIPPPAAVAGREALPTGVAGSAVSGGTEIPFTVFLCGSSCYGETSAAPWGYALVSHDMDGLPALVAAFADLDGDGFIGPREPQGSTGPSEVMRQQIRELEPVGRAVALFDGGVAQGTIAIRAALPASEGGLTIALTAAAPTGGLVPGTYDGVIADGPVVTTALPFVPQKDFSRFLRESAEPAAPNTTLYAIVQFAALPTPELGPALALALDGSSPTVDAAVVYSQPAVRAAFREAMGPLASWAAVDEVVLGTRASERRRRVQVVPVDRWNNPADPSPGMVVTVHGARPRPSQPGGSQRRLVLKRTKGRKVKLSVPAGTVDGTTGLVTAERDGLVVATLRYRVDSRASRPKPDVAVPSNSVPTIQEAIDGTPDRNGDGLVVVDVGPGLYRENLVIGRPVVLQGAGADRTIVRGDGWSSVIRVDAPNVTIRGMTAVGGMTGFDLRAASTTLAESRAWNNVGAGVSVTGDSVTLWRTRSVDNRGDGLLVEGASNLECRESALISNGGAGVKIAGGASSGIEDSSMAGNTGSGVLALGTALAVARGNRSIVNLRSGIEASNSSGSQFMANLSAGNDADGLHMHEATGDLVSGNWLANNRRYGLSLYGTIDADFSAAPGMQLPIGDNGAVANRQGDVHVSPGP